MESESRTAGISRVADMPGGTHFCLFYETQQGLLDTLVPYFIAGLENNECCIWVVSQSLTKQDAIAALRQALPDLARHLAEGSIDVLSYDGWYLENGVFDGDSVIRSWKQHVAEALAKGYSGMRLVSDNAWLSQDRWETFSAYEQRLDESLTDQRIRILCAYPTTTIRAAEMMDVARTHQFALAKRNVHWEIFETPANLSRSNKLLQAEIIERNQVADALRESAAKLKEAQRIGKIGYWEHDLIADRITWSQETGRIFGLPSSDGGISQAQLEDMTHPDDRQLQRQALSEALQHGRLLDVEFRIISSGGDMRCVHVRDEIVYDESGRPIRMFGTVQDITQRKQAEEELRRHATRLQELSRQVLQAQEVERRAIARELHDEIGQQLSAVGILLSIIDRQLPSELAQARLETAQARVGDLIAQVRNLGLNLRPAILDDFGLMPALVWLFERYTTQTQIAVQFEHAGLEEQRFAPEVETTAYRIVQEALTNVARHAGVTEVTVRLWIDADTLWVVVADHGHGFDPQTIDMRTSSGLAGMVERAALLGGTLTIESAPGTGTRVTASLPLQGDGAPRGQEHAA
jgi:two-component system, NarL family, sensor histidine kinase UhpB